MRLRRHRSFEKQYLKLKPTQQERLREAFKLFVNEPMHEDLRNHALNGEWLGYRSISFGGDWRAHYISLGDDQVLFVAVGTHSQLYK